MRRPGRISDGRKGPEAPRCRPDRRVKDLRVDFWSLSDQKSTRVPYAVVPNTRFSASGGRSSCSAASSSTDRPLARASSARAVAAA